MNDVEKICRSLLEVDFYHNEALIVNDFVEKAIKNGQNPCDRSCLQGHITTSAIVLDLYSSSAAMIHHIKHDKWLFPGGHCEPEDKSLYAASIREACEELGLKYSDILRMIFGLEHKNVEYDQNTPFDIDIHTIPFDTKTSTPEHIHYDFRYLMTADLSKVMINQAEVKGFKIVPVESSEFPARIRERLSRPDIESIVCEHVTNQDMSP